MDTAEILKETDSKMAKAAEALKRELSTIRTGRASPALLEKIRVDYYGVPTPLTQVASITAPEARLLIIQPWERQMLSPVEKALLKSDLGLTPTNDGNVIRLSVPPLTEERRQELIKLVRKRVETGRVALRNIRGEGVEALRRLTRDKAISEDELHRGREELQKLTEAFIERANAIGEEKEQETLEF